MSEKMQEMAKKDWFDRDAFFEMFKDKEPLEYFIYYTRYKYILNFEIQKNSSYWKTLSAIKPVIKDAFFTCNIEEKWDKYLLDICFADYMRFLLLNKLQFSYWFNSKTLKKISLLLRYDVICGPSVNIFDGAKDLDKELWADIDLYTGWPDYFETICKPIYSKEKYKTRLKEISNYMDKYGADVLIRYDENDKFEEALYYTFKYQTHMLLLVNQYYGVYKVSYLCDSAGIENCDSWIYFNLLFLLSEKHTEFSINWLEKKRDALLKVLEDWVWTMKHKQKYIENLRWEWREKLWQICANIKKWVSDEDLEKEYHDLEEKIMKNEIELSLWVYTIDDEISYVPVEFSQLFKDFSKAVAKTEKATFKISVKKWVPEYMNHKFAWWKEDLQRYEEMKEWAENWDAWHFWTTTVWGCKTWYEWRRKFNYKKKKKSWK